VRNANLPFHLYVEVDNRFLGPNMVEGRTRGLWHGVYSRPGQMLMCHVLLESGAHWSGLPLHALTTGPGWSADLEDVMPWYSMGEDVEAWGVSYLEGLRGRVRKNDRDVRHTGIIVDWADGFSRYPQEHKPLNLVVDHLTGWFSLLPNNHVVWSDKHFVNADKALDLRKYRRGEQVYWED
jgi:hypothetical protein